MIDPQICLTCTLPDCVHEPGGPPRALCPVEDLPPRKPVPEGYLTIRQAARIKQVSIDYILRRVHRGEFPGAKRQRAGKTAPWLIPETSLET
jgi:hypothetical protein